MGADYKKESSTAIMWLSYDNVNPNVTVYTCYRMNLAEATVLTIVPYDGLFEWMRAQSDVAPGAGETFTYNLRINGANSTQVVIAGAAAVMAEDLVASVQVTRGDEVCVSIVTSLNAAATTHRIGFKYRR